MGCGGVSGVGREGGVWGEGVGWKGARGCGGGGG